jgi:acyl-CoA thioesterase-1
MELPTNLDPIYREQFSALYSNISEEYGLPLIPFFLEDVATIPALNLADGIHPNKE